MKSTSTIVSLSRMFTTSEIVCFKFIDLRDLADPPRKWSASDQRLIAFVVGHPHRNLSVQPRPLIWQACDDCRRHTSSS